MNKLILLPLLLFFIVTGSGAQDSQLPENTRNFVLGHFGHAEGNPIHKEETDSINMMFDIALLNFSPKKENKYNDQVRLVLKKLYDNATGTYEDSNDVWRIKMRRSQCFAALALMSDDFSQITYIDLALHSLTKGEDCRETEGMLEQQYCSLLFLRMYIEYEYNNSSGKDTKGIREYILKNTKALSPDFISAANSLLNRWEK